MDTSFKSLISCGVCLELFDQAAKRSRMLSCGHSFCQSCLQKILLQSPSCPTCTSSIQFTTVESIPINFSLESLSNLGLDDDHKVKVEPDYEVLKKQISLRMEKELGERKVTKDKIKELLIVLDEKRGGLIEDLTNCEKQIEELKSLCIEEEKISDKLNQFQAVVKTSQSPSEISKGRKEKEGFLEKDKILFVDHQYLTPLSIESLGSLCDSEPVYVVDEKGGPMLYGKVAVKEGRIWISSFKNRKPRDKLIPVSFRDLLFRFKGSTDLPTTTFIKLEFLMIPNFRRIDVVIETDGHSPRAKNFVLLCSGLKGVSITGGSMTWFNFGGPSCLGVDQGSLPVIKEIREDKCRTPHKEGDVYGTNELNSWFWIQVKDQLIFPSPKFGVVVTGLQDLKAKDLTMDCSISECGIVI